MQKYKTAFLKGILFINWTKMARHKMRCTIKSKSAHAQMSHPKHGTVLVPLICLSITTHLFHWWTCLQYNDMWPTPEKQNIRQWITKHLNIKCATLDLLQHLQNHIPLNSSIVVPWHILYLTFSLICLLQHFSLTVYNFTICHSLIQLLLQFLW